MKAISRSIKRARGCIEVCVHGHACARAALRLDVCPSISWWKSIAEGIVDQRFVARDVYDNGCRGYVVPCVDQAGVEVDLLVAAKRMHTGDGDYFVHIITVYPIAVDGERFNEWMT